jgi:dTDP-glucose 4,6-dehydratase
MSKRVLVTGGCGFIGSHFCEYLLEKTDWEVLVLEGLTYAGDAGKLTGVPNFDKNRVKLFYHDLRAPIMDTLVKRIGDVNYVVNIASMSDVDISIRSPVETVLNNVQLILNVLEYVRQVRPEKFIQVSTDEVFGPALYEPAKEWDTHLPSNPYSASKAAQEDISFAYWRTYGIPLIITNTSNNFGERQHTGKLIPKTIQYLLEGKPVPVFAQQLNDFTFLSGSRTWLHAKNHADALLWLLNNQVVNQSFPDYVKPAKYNIGSNDEYTNLDIVKMIADIIGVKADYYFVNYHSARPGHDMKYALNANKLQGWGWVAPIKLLESLTQTVKWYMENKTWL